MESENTCEKSFKDDPENEQMSGVAEEASPEVEQEVSGADKEGSGADQEGSGADQEGSGADQEGSGADQEGSGADQEGSGADQEGSGAEQACSEMEQASTAAENTESAAEKANADSDGKEKSSSGAAAENDPIKEKTDDTKVSRTVAQHYNELQESGLEARGNSRIFYLRNFNNWIKSVLIGNTLQKIRKERSCDHKHVVLDMCSGKGGDMLKWKKGRISKLVCVDIASTSVEQSEVRFKDIVDRNQNSKRREPLFDAEFITADVTKQRLKDLYKDSSMSFDLVSCQFALHYSFESYTQADMMLKNVAECLQDGGYFIGTTPNSYELVNRLRNSESNNFGNDVYKVEFLNEDKNNLPLFGAQYSFQLEGVVDCPEFLVYFPALVKIAEKYNLKLINKKSFSEFFDENYNTSENRSLLGRMQALEPYPAENDAKLISTNEKDYSSAKDALDKALSSQQSNRRPFKAGTLSEAEWKAISLYMVFVFQKRKKQKDEPKPDSKDEPKPDSKDEPKPDSKDEPKPDSKDEPEAEAEAAPEPEADPEPEAEIEAEAEAEAESVEPAAEKSEQMVEEKRARKRSVTSDVEDDEDGSKESDKKMLRTGNDEE